MENDLLNISIFKDISEESKLAISKIKKIRKRYRQDELLIRSGERIQDICIIESGVVRCLEMAHTSNVLDSFYFSAGVSFPFYMLFGGEQKYTFDVYSVKRTKVIWIPWKELEPIIKKDMKLMNNILIFVSEYTCYNKMIARCLEYRKISERFAYWLLHLSKSSEAIHVPMSQEILSDILKVNRSSLNQEIVNLQRLNVIEVKNKNIIILDRMYLENLL